MAKVIKLSKTVYCKIIKEISDVIVAFDEGERMLIVSFVQRLRNPITHVNTSSWAGKDGLGLIQERMNVPTLRFQYGLSKLT